jgi:hypothetical protein
MRVPSQSPCHASNCFWWASRQPTKDARYNLRTSEDEAKFPQRPAGSYMLTNRLAGQPIWRLRVGLARRREAARLEFGNSVTVRTTIQVAVSRQEPARGQCEADVLYGLLQQRQRAECPGSRRLLEKF